MAFFKREHKFDQPISEAEIMQLLQCANTGSIHNTPAVKVTLITEKHKEEKPVYKNKKTIVANEILMSQLKEI